MHFSIPSLTKTAMCCAVCTCILCVMLYLKCLPMQLSLMSVCLTIPPNQRFKDKSISQELNLSGSSRTGRSIASPVMITQCEPCSFHFLSNEWAIKLCTQVPFPFWQESPEFISDPVTQCAGVWVLQTRSPGTNSPTRALLASMRVRERRGAQDKSRRLERRWLRRVYISNGHQWQCLQNGASVWRRQFPLQFGFFVTKTTSSLVSECVYVFYLF